MIQVETRITVKLPSLGYILRIENPASDFLGKKEIIKGTIKEKQKPKLVQNDLEVNFKYKNQVF